MAFFSLKPEKLLSVYPAAPAEKNFHSAAVKFLSFSPPQARIGKLKIYTAGILYQFISTETG
jgi:hypothetical protein